MSQLRNMSTIDAPRRTFVRFIVLAWLCMAAVIAYMCRNSIGVAEETIRTELHLSATQMGTVMSAFFLTYALFQIPTGWLGHVWGSRRGLPIVAVCWSAATAVMSLAGGLPMLVASRLGNGMSQAGLFPCATNTVAKWFPRTGRALANGSLASFMSVGGAVGAALTGVLLKVLSWRVIFAVYAGLGVVWAVGFYVWFRDRPRDHVAVGARELAIIGQRDSHVRDGDGGEGGDSGDGEVIAAPDDERREPTPWLAMFSSPAMWWICTQQFFRGAGYIFFASWFPTYLKETRHVTTVGSGVLTSLPLLAVVAGAIVGGGVSDFILSRTGSLRLARQGVAVAALSACALLIFAAYGVASAVLASLVISAGMFFAAVAGPCGYTITIDMGGRHVPTVFATMNMAGNLGAMLFPYVVPRFKEWTGSWESVLLLFGAMYAGAAAFWLLLRPVGTVFDQALIGRPARGESA